MWDSVTPRKRRYGFAVSYKSLEGVSTQAERMLLVYQDVTKGRYDQSRTQNFIQGQNTLTCNSNKAVKEGMTQGEIGRASCRERV